MDYFIWDKKSNLLGLSADVLFNSRPDLKYDDVIVIHKKGEPENIVMVETKEELRITYDINSSNADVVGFITAIILADDDPETIEKKLNSIDERKKEVEKEKQLKNEEDELFQYAKMIEDIMKKELGIDLNDYEYDEYDDDSLFNIPIPSGEYVDPECKVIDLTDVDDDVIEEKKMNIVLKHAFVSELSDVCELKCMESFNEQLNELEDKREQYVNESNFEMVEMTSQKIELMLENILDACDATLSIDVDTVYQYEDNVIVECTNGQTMIMQMEVVKSLRTSAVSYEKTKENTGEKYKVYYKTINVELNECYNEIVERGNTIFVVAV
jgi:hypothetical protein